LTPTPETDVNRTILLVDDDADVLAMLGRHFERTGWGVQRALEADGAMSPYERERPDVVLLDVGLPGVSGLRLLEVLRGRDPNATVVMLTGRADVETAVAAMRLGAENFLTKPVELGGTARRRNSRPDLDFSFWIHISVASACGRDYLPAVGWVLRPPPDQAWRGVHAHA
jgi:ActR/RegA family two-component response regulator